jgi:hypothetical protein
MPQHHRSAQYHRRRVRRIGTHDIFPDMPASRFEQGVFTTNVATWYDTWSTDECCTDVGNDVAVEVWHDHYVELLRFGDELHGAVKVKVESREGICPGPKISTCTNLTLAK